MMCRWRERAFAVAATLKPLEVFGETRRDGNEFAAQAVASFTLSVKPLQLSLRTGSQSRI